MSVGTINNLSHKEYAKKKCTVGIDAHKETNVVALAFSDMQPSTIFGKISADLNRTVDVIRKIQKMYDLKKEDLLLCYEAGELER